MPKPVCVDCGSEFKKELSGVYYVEYMAKGKPYKIWFADLWKCPNCLIQILSGYGDKPVSEHFKPDFTEWFKKAEDSLDTVYGEGA